MKKTGTPPLTAVLLCLAVSAFAEFQRGVYHADVRQGSGYGSATSKRQLSALRHLGVRWVSLSPFGYQEGLAGELIGGYPTAKAIPGNVSHDNRMLQDAELSNEIAAARNLGMRVLLRPQLQATDFWNGRQSPSRIRPPTPEAEQDWWQSYRAFILHYARLAQATHVDLFCVGSELVAMTTEDPRSAESWSALIRDVRKVYKGPLSYAAHWEREFDRIPFWNQLDVIGLLAWFPLDATAGASASELASLWRPHRARIQALQAKVGKPVIFMEAGCPAIAGGYQQPEEMNEGVQDELAQARSYQGLVDAFSDAQWWQGVYWSRSFSDPRKVPIAEQAWTFLGRPAARVVAEVYQGPGLKRKK